MVSSGTSASAGTNDTPAPLINISVMSLSVELNKREEELISAAALKIIGVGIPEEKISMEKILLRETTSTSNQIKS